MIEPIYVVMIAVPIVAVAMAAYSIIVSRRSAAAIERDEQRHRAARAGAG